jgi:hypothetical protein
MHYVIKVKLLPKYVESLTSVLFVFEILYTCIYHVVQKLETVHRYGYKYVPLCQNIH